MVRLQAARLEDPIPLDDPASIAPWRERRRARLAELLGPVPRRVPLELETLEVTRCEGYRREKVVFDTEDTMSVPAHGAALLLVSGTERASAPPGRN